MTYTYEQFSRMVAGTSCYTASLEKSKQSFVGLYNGSSFWGRIFTVSADNRAFTEILPKLIAEYDEEDKELLSFRESDFARHGYTIVASI